MKPFKPGWEEILIEPHPAGLAWARGKVPTPKGIVSVEWKQEDDFLVTVDIPVSGASSSRLRRKDRSPWLRAKEGVLPNMFRRRFEWIPRWIRPGHRSPFDSRSAPDCGEEFGCVTRDARAQEEVIGRQRSCAQRCSCGQRCSCARRRLCAQRHCVCTATFVCIGILVCYSEGSSQVG